MSDIFTYHLAALPGWTGYINHRNESGSDWQQRISDKLEGLFGCSPLDSSQN